MFSVGFWYLHHLPKPCNITGTLVKRRHIKQDTQELIHRSPILHSNNLIIPKHNNQSVSTETKYTVELAQSEGSLKQKDFTSRQDFALT